MGAEMPLVGSDKLHVLILAEQCHTTKHDIVTPTIETGIVTVAIVYCDIQRLSHNGHIYAVHNDWDLVEYCRQCSPDLVLLDPVRQTERTPTPTGLALAYIAWKLDIPVVGIIHDETPELIHLYDTYFPMCCHIVIFNGMSPVYHTKHLDRYSWDWWPMVSPSMATHPDGDRSIAVAMLGQIQEGSEYAQMAHDLRAWGIDIAIPSSADYIRVLQQSRIAITMSVGVNRQTFEACLCGALLLDCDNGLTWRFFMPNAEYIPFVTSQEAANYITYYLSHERERQTIANASYQRASSTYTATNWWKKLGFRLWREKSPWGLT